MIAFFLTFHSRVYDLKQWLLLAPSSGWLGDHHNCTQILVGQSSCCTSATHMLSFCKLGRLCLNYIFNRWRHVVPLTSTRRSLVPFKGIFSGEKFNYDVMLGAEMAFSPWNKGLFRNVLVTATQRNQMYCFHFTRHAQCVIKTFSLSHPCAVHSAICPGTPDNYNPIAWQGPC